MSCCKQVDLFSSQAEAAVSQVSCDGVMGRGSARQFKLQIPVNFKFCEAVCRQGLAGPGRMLAYRAEGLYSPKYAVSFPAKGRLGWDSRLRYIEEGLADPARASGSYGIASAAAPPLGCGLGGLKRSGVKPCIESALPLLPEVRFMVFEPGSASSADPNKR
ncbi:MAG: hypothetical protein LBP22_11140 [Deltaproteobacteria bacterium]|jgi:hypothetical protein|nr:hypothetical protein [Deltaproteobacteria bacterium]